MSVEVFISDESYDRLVDMSDELKSCSCVGILLDGIISDAYQRHKDRMKRVSGKDGHRAEDEPEEIA